MTDLEPGDADQQPQRLSLIVGVTILLAFTLVLVIAVGGVLFDFAEDEGTPPEVNWEFEPSDPPVLTHGGGDSVDCDRIFLGGDLGTGESLCTYFDGDVISEGDSTSLMPVGNTTGTITLEWEDRETGQVYPLVEPFVIE